MRFIVAGLLTSQSWDVRQVARVPAVRWTGIQGISEVLTGRPGRRTSAESVYPVREIRLDFGGYTNP